MYKKIIILSLSVFLSLGILAPNSVPFLRAQEKPTPSDDGAKESPKEPSRLSGTQPKALYFGNKDDAIHKTLNQAGFKVDISGSDEVISDFKKYQLIVVGHYGVCSQKLADGLKDFVGSGGGVIILSGVPAILTIPEPVPNHDGSSKWTNSDLSYIAEWFGAGQYVNTGGDATLIKDKPFKTKLAKDSILVKGTGGSSSAAITRDSLNEKATVIALWNSGNIYAFAYRYKDGRVYYQAGLGNQDDAELLKAASLWAANLLPIPKPTPELVDKINKLISELGDDNWQTREKATEELTNIGEPAITVLKEALKHEDPEVRMRAKFILDIITEP